MTSNYSRYALWIVLAFAVWLNYEAWQKDYSAVDAVAAAVAAAHIRTDLLDLMVSLTGGTITQVDLNEYSLHKGQTQRVRLENHDSPESLYLLQVALSGPAGAARPNQLATFTATQPDFQMAPGQDPDVGDLPPH